MGGLLSEFECDLNLNGWIYVVGDLMISVEFGVNHDPGDVYVQNVSWVLCCVIVNHQVSVYLRL